MSNDNNDAIGNVIGEALRKARQGAADAGYEVTNTNKETVERAYRERVEHHSRRTAVVEPVEARTKARGPVDADRLGIGVLLSRRAVTIDYPAEYRRHVSVPMEWLERPNDRTDRLIRLHCDPAWLRAVIGGWLPEEVEG